MFYKLILYLHRWISDSSHKILLFKIISMNFCGTGLGNDCNIGNSCLTKLASYPPDGALQWAQYHRINIWRFQREKSLASFRHTMWKWSKDHHHYLQFPSILCNEFGWANSVLLLSCLLKLTELMHGLIFVCYGIG